MLRYTFIYNKRFLFFSRTGVDRDRQGPTDASWRIVRSWWPGHGLTCDGGAMTLNHRPPSSRRVPQDSPSLPLWVPVPIPVSGNDCLVGNAVKTRASVAAGRRYERPFSSLPRSSRTRHAPRGSSRVVITSLQNRWVARYAQCLQKSNKIKIVDVDAIVRNMS